MQFSATIWPWVVHKIFQYILDQFNGPAKKYRHTSHTVLSQYKTREGGYSQCLHPQRPDTETSSRKTSNRTVALNERKARGKQNLIILNGKVVKKHSPVRQINLLLNQYCIVVLFSPNHQICYNKRTYINYYVRQLNKLFGDVLMNRSAVH